MNILSEIRLRFQSALAQIVDDPTDLLDMIRPSQEPKFGDYQANCAMPLGNRLGKSPRDVAADIVARLDVTDFCEQPEIAGPGFINLRLRDGWIVQQVELLRDDERLGIPPVSSPRTYVVDYSSPNVAKPMHVGHIRSTVIGDALCRTLRFLGHRAISDNHLGDWGTQFGMIIYGYKHFVDREAFKENEVRELGRLYKLVSQLVAYHDTKKQLRELETEADLLAKAVEQQKAELPSGDRAAEKKAKKLLRKSEEKLKESQERLQVARQRIEAVEANDQLAAMAAAHPRIGTAVLEETAKLHEGDVVNRRLWNEFLPLCEQDIERIYQRLDVRFDYSYGESFYQDRLADVVRDFQQRGMATESDGAICVFLDGFDAPMIIRKRDGAFLYATTDLATIQYRMQQWQPDAMLYVVDHRQSEHFEKLFAAARHWGYTDVELQHVQFGTVLGKDGRPYKTRSGDTVGLESLLDLAVANALKVVCQNDEEKANGPELFEDERIGIANVVGHAAIKYSDLSHNRSSDYKFDEGKMVALQGNTATYMQYSYARTQSIFRKGDVDVQRVRKRATAVLLGDPIERAMALAILRFHQALDDCVADYRPNQLTDYLFELATLFSRFFTQCPVLKAETDELRSSRLLLCDLTGRTIKQGLALLGIGVVEKM